MLTDCVDSPEVPLKAAISGSARDLGTVPPWERRMRWRAGLVMVSLLLGVTAGSRAGADEEVDVGVAGAGDGDGPVGRLAARGLAGLALGHGGGVAEGAAAAAPGLVLLLGEHDLFLKFGLLLGLFCESQAWSVVKKLIFLYMYT